MFGILGVVLGLLLIAVGVSMLRRRGAADRVAASWIPASGVVVGHDTGTVSPMTADATVTLRYPIVRYVDAQGREQQGRAVTAASWQRHPEGRSVGLRYDPANPGRVLVDGAPTRGVIGTVVGAVFVLFGVFWLLIGVVVLAVTR